MGGGVSGQSINVNPTGNDLNFFMGGGGQPQQQQKQQTNINVDMFTSTGNGGGKAMPSIVSDSGRFSPDLLSRQSSAGSVGGSKKKGKKKKEEAAADDFSFVGDLMK